MKLLLPAILTGFLLDCCFGDPVRIPHPVCLMGRAISALEKALRACFPKTKQGEHTAGTLLALVLVLGSGGTAFAILWICARLHPLAYFVGYSLMCWQIFAAKCLQSEAKKVEDCLSRGDVPAARAQIAMLVGRDTENLTAPQIIKAAVETVAENTSDGVIAPLFWMMLGGPVLGFAYKAVNTMDSMIGYKNERYLHFGRFAAKLDDGANFIPARLSALGMLLAAFLLGLDGKNAARIWRRDRKNHASPNSAQTESVCAGALHIQLGGDASYFGILHKKPFIGDDDRPPTPSDISKACRLLYGTTLVLLTIFSAAGWLIWEVVL